MAWFLAMRRMDTVDVGGALLVFVVCAMLAAILTLWLAFVGILAATLFMMAVV